MPLRFLPLQHDGLDQAVAMMAQLYSQGKDAFDAARARRATEKLLGEPEIGGVWMMDIDGVPAGYLVVALGYSLEFGGRFGLLDELFVAENHRGQGLGAQAVAFAEQQCRDRGWQALRLEVDHQNDQAQSLYSRSGFRKHDRFPMTKWI